jgi:hypothetical protein
MCEGRIQKVWIRECRRLSLNVVKSGSYERKLTAGYAKPSESITPSTISCFFHLDNKHSEKILLDMGLPPNLLQWKLRFT